MKWALSFKTREECSTKGGTNAGSCAEGFGVCCTCKSLWRSDISRCLTFEGVTSLFISVSLGCGSTTSENMTYFESGSTVNSGACRAKICKCNSNICQMRLDFDSFVISGPSTATTSNAKALNGDIGAGGKEINEASRCLTDTFSVSNQRTFPLICGTNSGYHGNFFWDFCFEPKHFMLTSEVVKMILCKLGIRNCGT